MEFKTVGLAHCGLPSGCYSLKDLVGFYALVLGDPHGSGIDKGDPRALSQATGLHK
ncbi:hypothetical protein LY58_03414 [Salegentibacter salegens]|nr:hypothetical protein LY58_03414 [Salegentibacter salegens]